MLSRSRNYAPSASFTNLSPPLCLTTTAKYPKDYPFYIYIPIVDLLSLFALPTPPRYSSTTVVSRYLEHADGRSTSGQPRFRIVNRARRLAGGRAVNSRRHIANSQGPLNCSFARGNRVSSRILAAYPISRGKRLAKILEYWNQIME